MSEPQTVYIDAETVKKWAKQFFPHLIPPYNEYCIWVIMASMQAPAEK